MSKIYNSTQQLSRVTLYVKVTWPWAWPFVSLVLMTQERWSFVLFCRLLGSEMSKIYNFTQQLSRVTLYVKVTWPWAWPFVSLVLMTQERWSFFVFCRFLGSGMSQIYNSTQQLSRVTLYVKVTWPWAWPFLSPVPVKLELWSFLFHWFSWGKDLKWT